MLRTTSPRAGNILTHLSPASDPGSNSAVEVELCKVSQGTHKCSDMSHDSCALDHARTCNQNLRLDACILSAALLVPRVHVSPRLARKKKGLAADQVFLTSAGHFHFVKRCIILTAQLQVNCTLPQSHINALSIFRRSVFDNGSVIVRP